MQKPNAASPSNLTSTDDDEATNAAKEASHFRSVLHSFESYLGVSLAANNARRRSYNVLHRSTRSLLNSLGPALSGPQLGQAAVAGPHEYEESSNARRGFKVRLDEMDDRVRRNAEFIEDVVTEAKSLLGGEDSSSRSSSPPQQDAHNHNHTHTDEGAATSTPTSTGNVEKVRSTLKQLVRDWSPSGSLEREASYTPILTSLESLFSTIPLTHRADIKILVPGCGLGRLAWEIALRGFSSQGNEFSFFMLVVSHFILNKTTHAGQHTVYPWVHSASNWRSAEDMLRGENVPDVDPNDLTKKYDASADAIRPPDFSMVAGDFLQVYSAQQHVAQWDAVATVFFLDTAHNVVEYIRVINRVLKIDGVWLNLGPLLWHFEGQSPNKEKDQQGSIELTLEEVLELVEKMGFRFEQRKTMPRQAYTGNTDSMLTYEYQCEFWVAKKVRDVEV